MPIPTVGLHSLKRRRLASQSGGFTPSDVPQAEADALLTLYNDGGGDSWTNNTGWGTDPVVGNWYGVTVSGGHVTRLDISNNNGSGDVSAFDPSALSSLVRLYLNNNSFSGDLSAWTLPSSLVQLYLQDNSFSGDLSGWSLPSSLARLYLYNNSFSGDLSGWSLPSSLVWLYLYNNSFTGDLSSWSLPSSLVILYLQGNSFSGAPGWIAGNLAMRDYRIQDNGMSVDSLLGGIWDRRDDFTYATPFLNCGGTNNAPTGTVQNTCPPVDPAEKLYNLAHAQCAGDSFNTWSVVYSGGSAP